MNMSEHLSRFRKEIGQTSFIPQPAAAPAFFDPEFDALGAVVASA
jgi:hypothetical protein